MSLDNNNLKINIKYIIYLIISYIFILIYYIQTLKKTFKILYTIKAIIMLFPWVITKSGYIIVFHLENNIFYKYLIK